MFLLTGNSRWLQLLCDSYPLRNMKRKRSCYKNELNPYQAIQCRLGSGRMMPVRARNTREPVNNRCSDYIWWVYGLTGCTDATLDRSPQISQVTIGDWEARRPINSQQIQLCVGAHSLRLGATSISMDPYHFPVIFSLTSHAFCFEVIPKRSKTAFRLADLLLFQFFFEVIPTSGHRERASYSLDTPQNAGSQSVKNL